MRVRAWSAILACSPPASFQPPTAPAIDLPCDNSLAALRKVNPNVLGAVLNAVDMKARGYYYSYYPKKSERSAPATGPRGRPLVTREVGDAPLI